MLKPIGLSKKAVAQKMFAQQLVIHFYAAALALMLSITFLIPIHTVISVNIFVILPLSVNGDSCKTEKSFIIPFWTMYSTI